MDPEEDISYDYSPPGEQADGDFFNYEEGPDGSFLTYPPGQDAPVENGQYSNAADMGPPAAAQMNSALQNYIFGQIPGMAAIGATGGAQGPEEPGQANSPIGPDGAPILPQTPGTAAPAATADVAGTPTAPAQPTQVNGPTEQDVFDPGKGLNGLPTEPITVADARAMLEAAGFPNAHLLSPSGVKAAYIAAIQRAQNNRAVADTNKGEADRKKARDAELARQAEEDRNAANLRARMAEQGANQRAGMSAATARAGQDADTARAREAATARAGEQTVQQRQAERQLQFQTALHLLSQGKGLSGMQNQRLALTLLANLIPGLASLIPGGVQMAPTSGPTNATEMAA